MTMDYFRAGLVLWNMWLNRRGLDSLHASYKTKRLPMHAMHVLPGMPQDTFNLILTKRFCALAAVSA